MLGVFFSGGINFKQLEEQKRLWWGPGAFLRIFKNLHNIMTYLMLCEQFLWPILFKFLALILSPPIMIHVVNTFSGNVPPHSS